MNLKKLKETLAKQCKINHETVIAIQSLRRFNRDCNIVEMMNPKSKVNERLEQ